ncbi:maleylpyruvate isomerase family mycothiol-dependent enzyme [Kribbella sp. NPDC051620]|uniref:maleylpyruvate isomerase family mycothiol-dependent enzyme n=1 Tax=Kribbella sp. NPDC051620 TaxID=3364120 RepID=UPI0037B7C040
MNLFAAAGAELIRIVSAVQPDAWNNNTPADLTVREVVDHVAAGNIFATRLLAGASAVEAVAGLDADQLGDNPLATLTCSCEAQEQAFATADQALVLHHPSGDISYDTFVRFRAGELVVHAWDIAVGAGLDPTLDPAVVSALWTIVEPHVDSMRAMGTYGPGASNTLPPDASPQSLLLDAFGRRPAG